MLYKNVYFRLSRNGYDGRSGWQDETFAKRFNDEIIGLFRKDGWAHTNAAKRAKYGGCPEIQKGLQELYIHPQAASGIVIAEDIPRIEAMLAGAQTFCHHHTDIYEDYVLMQDDEYLRHLESQRDVIVKDILERFKTKRRNLYFCGLNALGDIYAKYRVKRVGAQDKRRDLEAVFVFDVFRELLEQGMIRTSKLKYGDGYRTAKADEIADSRSA